MRTLFRTIVLSIIAFGAGIGALYLAPAFHISLAPEVVSESPEKKAERPKPTWHEVSPGISVLEWYLSANDNNRLILYRIAPETLSWRFAYGKDAQTIRGWQQKNPGDKIIINGSYFGSDFAPSGLLTISGKQIGSHAFDEDKSAVLSLSPKPRIYNTATKPAPKDLTDALQSYPLLVSGGNAAVKTESGLTARRSFVGTDRQGNFYVGVVPQGELTLFALAKLLPKLGVDWENALNLDGGPSTGLVAKFGEHSTSYDSILPVPFVLIGEKK